jgi:endonuclease-8
VHFLLYGTFSATVNGKSVTGDYKKARIPRLAFKLRNGSIEIYNGSVKIIEDKKIKKSYDYSIDIMSRKWDPAQALRNVKKNSEEEIADVLLDQTIFAGVGNIIKNEILSLAFVNPMQKVKDIPTKKLKELISLAKSFSIQFYKWRIKFVLRKHLKIHRRGVCPHCGGKVTHKKTGKRERWSHYCPVCQPLVRA